MSPRIVPAVVLAFGLALPIAAQGQYPPEVITSVRLSRSPVSLSYDGSGALYVVDQVATTVLTTDLMMLRSWGEGGQVLCKPFAVAAEDGQNCYVLASVYTSNCGVVRIHRFTQEGRLLGTFCGSCVGVALASSPYGGVYTVNESASSIWAFDADGGLVTSWSTGAGQSGVSPPKPDLAVGVDGTIYLTVPRGQRIVRFGPTGASLGAWTRTFYPTIQQPQAIDAAPGGGIYVYDGARGTIQRYDAAGTFLYEWAYPGLSGALAVDEDGFVYAGTSSGIVKFDNHAPSEAPPERREPHDGAILLHVGSAQGVTTGCEGLPDEPHEIVTKGLADLGGGATYYVYLLGSPSTIKDRNDGLTGLQMALDYTVTDSANVNLKVFGWQPCSVLDFPQDNWPQSGTGNTITWTANPSTCQRRDLVVAGYFYVVAYTPVTLAIIGYSSTGLGKIANCAGAEVVVDASRMGWVSFGGAERAGATGGCNPLVTPCRDPKIPVEPTTWGRLKTLFR
jgi:hypothetical protein